MKLSSDNRFFSFMSLLGDLIFLNVLFLLTSIPILTIGTSFCALYLAVKKRIHGEESYISRDYLKAWKENLKGGVCIWSVLLPAIVAMVFFTAYIASHLTNLLAIILYSILFIWLFLTLLYAFPLQATFINTPFMIIRNSILTALRHLPWTILLFLATYIPWIFTLVFPDALPVTALYWVLIGFSLSAVFSALIMKHVFIFYLPEEQN